MTKKDITKYVVASCHCGAVTIRVPAPPLEVTHCNCSLCRRYGVFWAYYPIADIDFLPDSLATNTYAWNGKNVDFHRCRKCGCLTHWFPRSAERENAGLNARLLDPKFLAEAVVIYKDSAGTGVFQ